MMMRFIITLCLFVIGVFILAKARGAEAFYIALFLMVPLPIYVIFKAVSKKVTNSEIYNSYKDLKGELATGYNQLMVEWDDYKKQSLIEKMNDFLDSDFHIPHYITLEKTKMKLNERNKSDFTLYKLKSEIYNDEEFWQAKFIERKDKVRKILADIEQYNKWPDYDQIRKLVYWDIEYKE